MAETTRAKRRYIWWCLLHDGISSDSDQIDESDLHDTAWGKCQATTMCRSYKKTAVIAVSATALGMGRMSSAASRAAPSPRRRYPAWDSLPYRARP